MERFVSIYDVIVNKISRVASVIAGLCIIIVAFIVTYEIIARGLFGSPTEWVLEVSTYLIIVAGFLGLAITLRHHAHVSVDFMTSRLSARTRCALDAVTTLLAILLFYVFMTEATDLVMASFEYNKLSPSILRFPLWIPQSSMIVGAVLLELELVRQLLDDIVMMKNGRFDKLDMSNANTVNDEEAK